MDKKNSEKGRPTPAPSSLVSEKSAPAAPPARKKDPPFYRRVDWIAFGVTALILFIAYFITLAPELTLEDSGELATGSFYAGVPHPPGYPVWTIFTWLFTVIFPFHNIAWRVALASATAGALACGLLALMVSRGSSLMIEGIGFLSGLDRRWENTLCVVCGFVGGALLGFNGFMWSQAVIVEVYPLSVFSFMGVLCCLMRWMYRPEQKRWLYLSLFLFGICFTNHQTLLVAAVGLEVLAALQDPKLGGEFFLGNTIIFLGGLFLKHKGMLPSLATNPILFAVYYVVGILSAVTCGYLLYRTRRKLRDWLLLGRDLLFVASVLYLALCILIQAQYIYIPPDAAALKGIHFLGLCIVSLWIWTTFKLANARFSDLSLTGKISAGASALYLLILIISTFQFKGLLNSNVKAFAVFNGLGLLAVIVFGLQLTRRWKSASEIRVVSWCAIAWLLGAAFYFYMPLASMTNPPMNWGYPRTWDGFIHVITRGQYEKINPTNIIQHPGRFIGQLGMYFGEVIDEFNLVYLLIGLVPFLFLPHMKKREQRWLFGLLAVYLCLAILLLILLNPGLDRQSRELTRVFFTSSHLVVAMLVGYGLALLTAYLVTQPEEARPVILYGLGGAALIAIYSYVQLYFKVQLPIDRYTALFGMCLALAAFGVVFFLKRRAVFTPFLCLVALMPVYSVAGHWWDNEQRGHWFGYWFGHDMFTPPFHLYPKMAKHAILFGGTDPGRFCPTYMIFCESFIPPSKKRDPNFDRRDVYIITQNALADATYLEYIRAQYFRSAQIDPPFFQVMLRSPQDVTRGTTNLIAQMSAPLDNYFMALGKRIEQRRRKEGVYPPKEIYTPSNDDSQQAFSQYMADAERRYRLHQLEPGEQFKVVNGRFQVTGQVAVMKINAILAKDIFDKNPDHEFYVEESFPLAWMYPYLTPYGIIMKVHRKAVPEITEAMVKRDHEFWSKYSSRLIGNWITYDTPVKAICDFAQRLYLRGDFTGFKGDPKFIRDDDAQKAFSKLRSSIASSVYNWRFNHAKTLQEKMRMQREADFAYRQAIAFCPYSPEAVFHYVQFLLATGGWRRLDDALLLAQTFRKFDPDNPNAINLVKQLKGMKSREAEAQHIQGDLPILSKQFQAQPTNLHVAFQLASAYVSLGQTSAALRVLDTLAAQTNASPQTLLSVAQGYLQLKQTDRLERLYERIVKIPNFPNKPEAWYDLAGIKALLLKTNDAINALTHAIELSNQRLAKKPSSRNLAADAANDPRFNFLHPLPAFQKLIAPK